MNHFYQNRFIHRLQYVKANFHNLLQPKTMSYKKLMIFYTIFLLTFGSLSTFAQNKSYQFIEPNISISYDSNLFQIVNRYSNTLYETESYDFTLRGENTNKVSINIRANDPIYSPAQNKRGKPGMPDFSKIKKLENDSVAILDYDKKFRRINGFDCAGAVSYDKKNNQYNTSIVCLNISTNDFTELIYTSSNTSNLDSDYKILKNLLSGFKTYSQKEIIKEEKRIKGKYTVVVLPQNPVDRDFSNSRKTFIVKTKEKPENVIKEVRVKNDIGHEVFDPEEDGTVIISCKDKQKGNLTKESELVLLNSFGKKVKIPFTFSYDNND